VPPEEGRQQQPLSPFQVRQQARQDVHIKFKGLWRNEDVRTYRVAQEVLQGDHRWLEEGMVELE
jgi:hypothetical protein